MKEQLIKLDTAKLAKEKGFHEPCNHYYDANKKYNTPQAFDGNIIEDDYYHDDYYLRPTQSLLQKWLRDNHNINILIKQGYGWEWYINPHGSIIEKLGDGTYNSYEEALEEGLLRGLELINEGFCKWKMYDEGQMGIHDYVYKTSCGRDHIDASKAKMVKGDFCQFCGKKIKFI